MMLLVVFPSVLVYSAQHEDLSILKRWIEWSDSHNSLQQYLNKEAFRLLAARAEKVSQLRDAASWKLRQQEVKSALLRLLGPFPEKTALNARIVGVVSKPGYRIEKITFESVPGFHVTACLFVPDQLRGKRPAILNVIGHTDIAFRAPMYQQLILNLVKKGFIVLAMDPIGQGERLQYYDPAQKRSLIGGPTTEHSYVGRQCFLAGSSLARYFAWDGIRAIDYLVSRPEVDPIRIGVTGISGGGTQTSYIAALDERVTAAAPTCYITGFERLFGSIGPQDAEQNFNGGVAAGIDHGDFLEVRAPKPTLVVATTRDFFSIQGTRETVAEAQAAFRALGSPDRLSLVEDDFGHGYTKKTREAIYSFFQKHLDNPGSAVDEEVELLSRDELTVTRTGQVIDSLGGETVFSLNRAQAARRIERLKELRERPSSHFLQVKAEAKRITGYQQPGPLSGLLFRGRYGRDGYSIEMHAVQAEGDYVLPLLLMVPEGRGPHPALLYIHPQGKSAGAAPGGEMEWFVRRGFAVLSPDLSGTGELGTADLYTAFLGVQTGRSVVGIRAADIIRALRFLQARSDIDSSATTAVARGGAAVPLVHAAVFDDSIARIALVEPLVSFRSVVMNRFFSVDFADTVASALAAYDLPDLEACLAPRPLLIVNARDQLSSRADAETLDTDLRVVRSAYSQSGTLSIRNWEPFQTIDEILLPWLMGK